MSKTIGFSKAQKKLVVQWCVFSVVVFIIYLIQTFSGKFEGFVSDVWEWLFQFIVPPLTLMIGVLISQVSSKADGKETDLFYFRLASGISYFFLILLLFSSVAVPLIHQSQNANILVTEITEDNQKTIIDAFKSYNLFLLPVQGITTLVLGLFFSKS